jgi:hypothetical protein
MVTPFQQYMFPSSQAPTYSQTHGYPAALVFVIALTLMCSVGIGLMERREIKRAAQLPKEEKLSDVAVEQYGLASNGTEKAVLSEQAL